ncbi:MAG: DNA-binding response regulator [Arcobacter sp.]|nr:MAG: DNA-binding response regulator [Arcobacter sp.]
MQGFESNFLKSMNVLYIEDDPIVSSQTIKLLKFFFKDVYHCDNAEIALDLFEQELIHLIISDIELPKMNGLTFCKKIRETNQQIPIFITTIHDGKDKLLEAVKLNLTDYLIKPVSITSLQKTLIVSYQKALQNGALMVSISDTVFYNLLCGQVERKDQRIPIPLAKIEIKLLNLLLEHKNQIVTRETIERVISPDKNLSDPSYKSLIFRLRKKIGKDAIISLSGVGIKLNTEDK